jgi:hypothetical protein
MFDRLRYYSDWLFRDLTTRKGKYVIAENPNIPLLLFMISIVLAVFFNPGLLQNTAFIIAFASLVYWGIQEFRGGRSRFRKLLGILAIISVIGAVLLFRT